MQPVPSSIVNFRNLLGLCSRQVTMQRVPAREMDKPLREKESGSEGFGVRVMKSMAKSFTWVW